ncbi:MAG TPA: DUF2062 domain-containing protein [Dongiaceae bacterium]|jgi:uncharacterized protein (DUF2062 family)|nr:DUF2062 domain-containing protein [Dongiaceae bacterium]
MGRRRDFWDRAARLVRFRLVVPLMRSRHPPEYSARGTAVGLAWAFTPTVGIQMPIVLATWLVARRVFRWDFSLILGLAWTWATNVFTALPCYYVFYVTGRLLLGRWDDVSGYERFLALWRGFFSEGQTLEQQVVAMFDVVVRDWGLAMWVGCIPWSALVAFLGYRWSLKFIHAYRRTREHRAARRRQRRQLH